MENAYLNNRFRVYKYIYTHTDTVVISMYIAMTGSVCSGKTGVSDELVARRYNLREEIARPMIARREIEDQNQLPWSKGYEDEFQLELLEKHLELDTILHYGNDFCFQDTTYLDPLTFLRVNQAMRYNNDLTAPYSEAEIAAREMIKKERDFRKSLGGQLPTFERVFCLERLDSYEKDPQRQFDPDYARILHDAKKVIYTGEYGYDMIDVPIFQTTGSSVPQNEKVSRSIDARVRFILGHIPKNGIH